MVDEPWRRRAERQAAEMAADPADRAVVADLLRFPGDDEEENGSTDPAVVCVGGCVADRKLHLLAPPVAGTSNPARGSASAGGVARNVAENLARLGVRTALVSAVGADAAADVLIAGLSAAGVDTRGVRRVPGGATAQYVAVLDTGGGLVLGVADMEVLASIAPDDVDAAWPAAGAWVLADANLAAPVLAHVLGLHPERTGPAAGTGVRLAVEAVSTLKVTRLPADLRGVDVLFCNEAEARAWSDHHAPHRTPSDDVRAEPAARLVAAGARGAVVSLGERGALVADAGGVRHVPAVPAAVVDVTGAGDALVAGTLAALAAGAGLDDAVRQGVRVAALTVASPLSVRTDLAEAVGAARPDREGAR